MMMTNNIKACQDKSIKCCDTFKDLLSFPIGSTVALQWEDSGPQMHEVITEASSTDLNGWSYIIKVTKMGRLITHNMTHLKDTDNGGAVPQRTDVKMYLKVRRLT